MPTRRWTLLIAMLVSLTLSAAACSVGDSATEATISSPEALYSGQDQERSQTVTNDGVSATTVATSGQAMDASAQPANDEDANAQQEDPAGNGGTEAIVDGPVDLGRDIIFTADLTVAVQDVAEAGSRAARIIERFGGLLFGQETTGGNRPRTVLTFKVFPADFQAVLNELGSIGVIRNQNVSATDVTERVVDLRSRITTAQASVERLRAFLANAQDLETIASLENQLLERETDLETLRGQLRTMENQVSLATIVLTLTEAQVEPAIVLEASFYPGHDDGGFACPGTTGLTVETGEEVTACFFISNTGDTPLSDLTLVDSILGITIDDLTPVLGDPQAVLLPGESVMLSHETIAQSNIRTRTTVTGTPADPDGVALDERAVAATVSGTVQTVDPGGITSFTDGLAESWTLLVSIGRIALLGLAWILPFSWLLLIGWWFVRRSRMRFPAEASKDRPAPPEETEDTKHPTMV